uniref:Elicitin n=1 Tax=Globisporangium ultimum (strain ATCC 200006 / CBS 805.95 / DAOM BR144) TaxID=431595 RepID=K3WVC0_GLOUD
MKFSFVAVAATLAVASAVDCDLTKLAQLLDNSNATTCSADSGLSFTSVTQPSSDLVAKICNSTACMNVMAAVKTLNLGDCMLFGTRLETDLLNPIDSTCGTGSKNATGNSTDTPTPRNTTGPTGTSSGSSDAATTDSPSTGTTPTPTPSPTSAASSVAMAASAIVVVVAAAFL